MKVLSALFTTTLLSLIATTSTAAKDEPYVYGKDPKKDAEYDISMGMAGIQQAAQDPKLLAQLFQDMQVSEGLLGGCFVLCVDMMCHWIR
jgi:hypothetical protein